MFCKYCGAKINEDAKFCDKCGARLASESTHENLFKIQENQNVQNTQQTNSSIWTSKKKWSARTKKEKSIILTTLIASIIVVVIICFIPEMVSSSKNNAGVSDSQATSGLTYSNFSKIQNGMSYNQVCQILGKEGKISTEASSGDYSLAYYTWESDNRYDFVIITVGFKNGEVCAKSQVGLK